jgi:hypothetical protein
MRIRYPALFGPMLLLITMGATDCEYFDTVTVPAVDNSAPTVFDGVWLLDLDDYDVLEPSYSGDVIKYHFVPGEPVFPIGSAIDSGGLKKLTISTEVSWTCCDASKTICSNTQSISSPIVETQSGGVGSSVSNGIYSGTAVGPSLPTCSGSTPVLKSYRFSWTTTGQNFHGGITTGKKHSIVWP